MVGVSVIIPVYNRGKYIRKAIDSVLEQEFDGKVEVIVVDDGSTDDSIEIVNSYGDRIVFVQKPNYCQTQGAASARNRGIRIATQEFVSFLDSDDFYLPGFIKNMVEILKQNEDYGFAFCRLNKIDENNLLSVWTRQKITKMDILYPFLFRSFGINTDTIILRRSVFDVIGFFREDLTNGEDGDLWMRISEHYRGIFLDMEGAVYRYNHGAQLTKNEKMHVNSCAETIFIAALERNLFKNDRDDLRLLLIFRILFGIQLEEEGNFSKYSRLKTYYKLFMLYPGSFLKMLRLYLCRI